MTTGKQIRAARVLAEWDAEDLAAKTKLTRETIFNIERGVFRPRPATLEKIVKAFSDIGIEFIENEGVRRRPEGVEIFEGAERFDDFYDFLYEHLKRYGGEVCLSISNQSLLAKYRKDPKVHYDRMKALFASGIIKPFRILASESEYFHRPMYSVFKVQPEGNISPTGFWAFGDCLALISFVHSPAPYVVVLRSAPLAAAYRQAFDIAWAVAKEPPPPPPGMEGEE
jgi:transcriptional regulator with XRE-family HTH domain